MPWFFFLQEYLTMMTNLKYLASSIQKYCIHGSYNASLGAAARERRSRPACAAVCILR